MVSKILLTLVVGALIALLAAFLYATEPPNPPDPVATKVFNQSDQFPHPPPSPTSDRIFGWCDATEANFYCSQNATMGDDYCRKICEDYSKEELYSKHY